MPAHPPFLRPILRATASSFVAITARICSAAAGVTVMIWGRAAVAMYLLLAGSAYSKHKNSAVNVEVTALEKLSAQNLAMHAIMLEHIQGEPRLI